MCSDHVYFIHLIDRLVHYEQIDINVKQNKYVLA